MAVICPRNLKLLQEAVRLSAHQRLDDPLHPEPRLLRLSILLRPRPTDGPAPHLQGSLSYLRHIQSAFQTLQWSAHSINFRHQPDKKIIAKFGLVLSQSCPLK